MKKVLIALLVFALLAVAGCSFGQTPVGPKPESQFVPTSDPSLQLDSDRDGMSDWFEENISQTNPLVYNARFVILASVDISNNYNATIPKDRCGMEQPMREFFVEKEKIPAENVFLLIGNWEDGATFSNFQEAVSKVAERSDGESFVFVFLWSHGGGGPDVEENTPAMSFADGKGYQFDHHGHYYSEISKILNRIECKMMLVGVHSCALETALEPLAKDAACPRVVVFAARDLPGTLGEQAPYYTISDVIYGNGDGYVSCEEAAQFLINDGSNVYVEPKPLRNTVINDKSDMASMIYLGDFIPKAYSYNRVILKKLKENGEYHGWYGCPLEVD